MSGLLRFFTGSRTLSTEGSAAGEVMNLCRHYGFVYWNLRFCDGRMLLETSLLTAKKLLSACEQRGILMEVASERGLPSLLWRYRRRLGVAVGAVCFFAIIFCSSRVLWSIEVRGNRAMSDAEVLSELRDSGLTLGMPLSELDTEVLENRVLIASDEISWLSVNLIGTVAHVELREVEPPPPEKESYDAANLVASRSGRVELLEDVRGKVVVSPGAFVSEGELLVSGLYDAADGSIRYRCAEGKVFARTEREFLVEIPFSYEQKCYTGRKKKEKRLIFFEKEIKFFTNSRNLPTTYDTIDTVEYFALWDGRSLPVGIRTVEYREYEMRPSTREPEQAKQLAYERLAEQMSAEVGAPLWKRVRCEMGEDACRLFAKAEYLENIAIVKKIEIEEAS